MSALEALYQAEGKSSFRRADLASSVQRQLTSIEWSALAPLAVSARQAVK
jgi:hypothetical protein